MRTANVIKQKKFLAAYAQRGNVRAAADIAGVSRNTHYDWMRDPEYAEQFRIANEDAMDLLVDEARRRGYEGWEEPVVYQGQLCYPITKEGKPGGKPLAIRRYDSQLLTFLIKGGRPEYRDSWKGELSVKADATHHIDLKNLPDEKLDQLIHILESSAGDAAPAGYALGCGLNGKGHALEEPDS